MDISNPNGDFESALMWPQNQNLSKKIIFDRFRRFPTSERDFEKVIFRIVKKKFFVPTKKIKPFIFQMHQDLSYLTNAHFKLLSFSLCMLSLALRKYFYMSVCLPVYMYRYLQVYQFCTSVSSGIMLICLLVCVCNSMRFHTTIYLTF